jgi:hypothetical protein
MRDGARSVNDTTSREAAEIASAILEDKRGICEGSRALARLAHGLVADWRVDPDFVVFGALDSDSDRFPVGDVRRLWEPSALAALDIERAQMEERARPDVMAACRSVLARFGEAR